MRKHSPAIPLRRTAQRTFYDFFSIRPGETWSYRGVNPKAVQAAAQQERRRSGLRLNTRLEGPERVLVTREAQAPRFVL